MKMQNNKIFTTKKFYKWSQYLDFINQLTESWCFRGQSNSEWRLKTSFERTDFFNLYEDIERTFFLEFQRGAKNFINEKDIPENTIEWLALMQHHGAPTRLLDFTKSPYIAAYFAFEKNDANTKEVAIWGMNYKVLRDKAEKYLELRHSEEFEQKRSKMSDEYFEKTRRRLSNEDIEQLFILNNKSCVLPVEPFKMNTRFALQQSIFISTGNTTEPFMDQLEYLEDDTSKTVIKIILPSSIRKEVLQGLQKMNINRTSLFPGLDGYSQGLSMRYNLLDSMYQQIEKQLNLIKNKKFNIYP